VKFELHQSEQLDAENLRVCNKSCGRGYKIENIANELYVSRDYIGKLFKQKAGYNLSEYITKVKMEHAKYLISKGEYKNYEISEILGYKKADYFSQVFKSYVGCTPSEYRKNAGFDFLKLQKLLIIGVELLFYGDWANKLYICGWYIGKYF